MIIVTSPSGDRFGLNPDLIMRVDGSPNAVITMVDGTTFQVAESVDHVAHAMTSYRVALLRGGQVDEQRQLRPVPPGQPFKTARGFSRPGDLSR